MQGNASVGGTIFQTQHGPPDMCDEQRREFRDGRAVDVWTRPNYQHRQAEASFNYIHERMTEQPSLKRFTS